MKQTFYAVFLLASLGACRDDDTTPATNPAALVGRWRLSARQCYCPAGPVPDEVLTFEASGGFQFFRNGQLANQGAYFTSLGEVCSGAPRQPLLRFAGVSSNSNNLLAGGSYSLRGNTLVIDQGTYCLPDVAVSTYERQP